jgi:hypothetical protein
MGCGHRSLSQLASQVPSRCCRSANAPQSPHPLWVSLINPSVRHVNKASHCAGSRPAARHRLSSQPGAASARSTPPIISVLRPTVVIAAGSGWAIFARTVIPAVAPGDSCIATAAAATFSKPTARSFMVSRDPLRSWCRPLQRWPKAWAFAPWPASLLVDPTTVLR